MGLLDSVIGSVTGKSSASGSSSMSPLMKALLLLLAANAASKYLGKGSAAPQPAGTPTGTPGTIDSGLLKGLPSLDGLLDKLKGAGHGDTVQSWIGHGSNTPIAPQQLASALGPEAIDQLAQETNMPRDQLMSQLSGALPQVVDKLTPDGKLPASDQRSHW
jgi:uncharacterized protein YidB (DUF937 family)